jgi:hypothetical protein
LQTATYVESGRKDGHLAIANYSSKSQGITYGKENMFLLPNTDDSYTKVRLTKDSASKAVADLNMILVQNMLLGRLGIPALDFC